MEICRLQINGHRWLVSTLELFILLTESLTSLAATSIFANVSSIGCSDPSFVFCNLYPSFRVWYQRKKQGRRRMPSETPAPGKDQTDRDRWTWLWVGRRWCISKAFLRPPELPPAASSGSSELAKPSYMKEEEVKPWDHIDFLHPSCEVNRSHRCHVPNKVCNPTETTRAQWSLIA